MIENSKLQETIGLTLGYMYKRELRRNSHGHYKRSSSEKLWTLLIIITFLSIVGAVVYGSNSLQYYMEKWKEFTLITFLFPIIVYIILKVSMLMKWILYWIIVATGLLFLLDTTKLLVLSDQDQTLVAQYIFAGFIVIELITFFVYIWIQQIFPNLVLYFALGNPRVFWEIKPLAKPGFYTRKTVWPFQKRKTFYFSGQVDELQRPHGVGKFIGEWSNSEVLYGYFQNGYPLAPFKSREYRSGYTFSAVRLGFVAFDAAGFKKSSFNRLTKGKWGVAGVECSTSGRFFSDLPHAELILDPYKDTEYSAQDCLDNILHFNDLPIPKDLNSKQRITIEYSKTGIAIPGYKPISPDCKSVCINVCDTNGSTMTLTNRTLVGDKPSEAVTHGLQIDGWVKEDHASEVLLYVPGFNASMESALETLGQFLNLGVLPPRIKPVIFGWPGGTLVMYLKAITIATSDQTTDHFIQVIKDLQSIGIKKIHILCHSMGARIVTKAAHRFNQVFKYDLTPDVDDKIELKSVTFLNPETSLDDFIAFDFDMIRNHTSVITMYGNENDVALRSAEWISFKTMLGNRVHNLARNSDPESPDTLDIDVIDTTALDMNIHSAKHSYFNLNKYIIDDVIDVITNTRRAIDRDNRLLNIDKNVYCFLSAPSYVVNK